MPRFYDRSRPRSFVEQIESMLYQIKEVMEDEVENQRFLDFQQDNHFENFGKNAIYIGYSEKHGPIALDASKLTDTRILIVGKSGSGKSYLTRTVIERMFEHGVLLYIFDPEGEWLTLREKYDFIMLGKKKGLNCDIEINEENAKLVFEQCLKNKVSAIFDLSEWSSVGEKQSIVLSVNQYIIHEMPRDLITQPMNIVYEEAAQFAKKGKDAKVLDIRCRDSLKEVASLGRKRGISSTYVTQRLPFFHQDIRSQCSIKLMGLVDSTADVESSATLIGIKLRNADILKKLDKEFIAYGQYFCHSSKVKDETVIFKSDTPKSPHWDLIEINSKRYKIPKPSNKLQFIIANIERQLSQKTPKTSPDLEQSDQIRDLTLPDSTDYRSETTVIGLDPSKVIWQEDIDDRFAKFTKVFGSISIENLCVLSVIEYDEEKVKNWAKNNSSWIKILQGDICTEEEFMYLETETAQEIINQWKNKIQDDTYEKLLQYLYEDADENNSLGDVAEILRLKTKEVVELVKKYEKYNLIAIHHNSVYLNTILFENKIDKLKREHLIEFEDDEEEDENEFI